MYAYRRRRKTNPNQLHLPFGTEHAAEVQAKPNTTSQKKQRTLGFTLYVNGEAIDEEEYTEEERIQEEAVFRKMLSKKHPKRKKTIWDT